MTYLTDIVSIVFACTAVNHLGLIHAIQMVAKRSYLPVVGCVKCFTFWAVLCYCLVCGVGFITSLAISLLSAWSAIWLDLLMGIIDQLYTKIYDTIYSTANTPDTDALDTSDSVSELSE